jgi:hypothetical protein
MDPINTLSILSSESRRGGHSVAAMCRYDFLVGLESPACLSSAPVTCLRYGKRKPLARSLHSRPTRAVRAGDHQNALHIVVGLNMVFLMFPIKTKSHNCNVK